MRRLTREDLIVYGPYVLRKATPITLYAWKEARSAWHSSKAIFTSRMPTCVSFRSAAIQITSHRKQGSRFYMFESSGLRLDFDDLSVIVGNGTNYAEAQTAIATTSPPVTLEFIFDAMPCYFGRDLRVLFQLSEQDDDPEAEPIDKEHRTLQSSPGSHPAYLNWQTVDTSRCNKNAHNIASHLNSLAK